MNQLRIVATNPGTLHSLGHRFAEPSDQQLRAEYASFCDDIKRDLAPIEAEFGGCPTFTEWMEYHRHE